MTDDPDIREGTDAAERDERTVHQGGELVMTGSGVRERDQVEPASTNHGGDLELTGDGMRPVADETDDPSDGDTTP